MYDVLIIGAGVVGTAIARRLSRYQLKIAILEAAMRVFGMEEIALSAHGNMDGFLKKKFKEMY